MKKTINIDQVLESANAHLERTDAYATQEFKAGICTLIERILLDTKRYDGFSYVTPLDGTSPENEYNRCYHATKKS